MTPDRIAPLIEAAAARLTQSADPLLDAETLFRGVSGFSRAVVLSSPNAPVSPEIATRFDAAITRRERHEPIQYILGVASFWRDEFVVNPAVLIPRPETELLVEMLALRLRGTPRPRILDVGTGSGCIALSLLRELPEATAVAADVSLPALAVAAENAQRFGLTSRIDLRSSRWFDGLRADEGFDAIVSNPPYVAIRDKDILPADVRDFEPALALFADATDDLSSYRILIEGLETRLKPAGLFAFEVGLGQAQRVADLATRAGLSSLEILDDLASIPRVVLGRRP